MAEVDAGNRPTGLVRSLLDFVLRYSLLWAGGSIAMSLVILTMPRGWFGDPWSPDDPRFPAAGVQCLIALFFSLVALVRTRFSEADRDKPSWRLVLKALLLTIIYFFVSVGGAIILIAAMDFGMLLAMVAVLVLLFLGAVTHRSGGTAKEISDRRARRIAPAIILAVMIIAAAMPSMIPSAMAKNEHLTIECLRSVDAGRSGGRSLVAALARASSDWQKASDGSPSWYGFVFSVEDIPAFGGECLVARPTHYNRTGIDTFVLAPDGVVWQCDLGVDGEGSSAEWDPNDAEMPWIAYE